MTFEKNLEIDWKLIFNYSSYVFCAADIKNYIEKFIKYYGNEASNWLLFLLLTFLCDFPARSTSCIWLSLFFTFLLQVLFVCNVEGLDKHLREGKVKGRNNRERVQKKQHLHSELCMENVCAAYARHMPQLHCMLPRNTRHCCVRSRTSLPTRTTRGATSAIQSLDGNMPARERHKWPNFSDDFNNIN